jgi:hypothetical protein
MKQVFRSKFGWALGWIWLVFAAVNAVDLANRGEPPSALIAGAVLGVVTVLVFILVLRPAIVAEAGGVRARNPFRDIYVPWHALDDVTVSNAIVIESGDISVRCWTPQPNARERARAVRRGTKAASDPSLTQAERAAAEAFAGRTHADWVAQQLREMAANRKADSTGEVRQAWSIWAIAASAAALAMIVLAFTMS